MKKVLYNSSKALRYMKLNAILTERNIESAVTEHMVEITVKKLSIHI